MKKFQKFIKAFLIGLLVLVIVAVTGGYFFLKNFDIKKYKPSIIRAAEQALGRPVDFQDIQLSVSITEGVRFHLSDFTIADNPAFGTGPFFSTHQIEAGIDILPFLKARQISIPTILIRAPRVTLIRDAGGMFNIQTINSEAKQPSPPSPSGQAAMALPAILIKALKIENAEIQIIDLSTQPQTTLSVKQLDFSINNLSLTHPFELLLEAAVLSPQKNLRVSSNAQIYLQGKKAELSNLEMTADLGTLALDELRRFPMLTGIPIPKVLGGQFQTSVKELTVSDKGLGQVLINASLTNGTCVFPEVAPGITLEAEKISLKLTDFSLDEHTPFHIALDAALFNTIPNINFTGRASLNLARQAVTISNGTAGIDLKHFPLKKIQASGLVPPGLPLPETLAGEMRLDLKNVEISAQGIGPLLADFRLNNGAVSMPELTPDIALNVRDINLEAQNISLQDPFLLQGSLAYENDVPNLTFRSTVALDLTQQSLLLTDGTVSTDLAHWSMERLKSAIGPLKEAPLPDILAGKMAIMIKRLAAGPLGLTALQADLALTGGRVRIPDAAPGVTIETPFIETQIKDFSLTSPFSFDVNMAYLNDKPNIHTRGTAQVNVNDQSITLTDTTARLDLSSFDIEQLKTYIAAVKDAPLPANLQGDLTFSLTEMHAGAKGLISLDGRGDLKNGLVKMNELAVPLEGINTAFHFTSSDITMDTLTAFLGKGQITVQFAIKDYLAAQTFATQAELKDISLAEILDQQKADIKIAGLVSGNFQAKGNAADLNSITGEGAMDIKEAKLKNLNVLKKVLDSMSFLPNLSARLEADLPDRYKKKLQDKDTDIRKIAFTGTISGGKILIEPAVVEADEFLFSGKAAAGFDQKYTMDGPFKIPADLSAAITRNEENMQYFYDPEGNITLPIHVLGVGAQTPTINVLKTMEDIIKNAARNKGKEELKKVLQKAIGMEPAEDGQQEESRPDTGTGQQEQPAQEKPQSVEGQIIEGIFNQIFK